MILRATWDYIERLDEFLAWAAAVPNLLNSPDVVAWNTDKHYLHDLAVAGVPSWRASSSSRIRLFTCLRVRWWSNRRSERVRLVRNGSPITAGRDTMRRSCRRPGRRCWFSPMTRAWPMVRPRWCSWPASSRTLSPRGRCCRIPGAEPVFDPSGTYAEETLSPADPDTELWDVGYAALAAAADHLGMQPSDFLYARVDIIGGHDDPRLLELEMVEPAWAGASSTRTPGDCSNASSRSGWSQPSSGWASVRSRIDAHSAAVRCRTRGRTRDVHGHQRGRHAGEELHDPDACPVRTPARRARRAVCVPIAARARPPTRNPARRAAPGRPAAATSGVHQRGDLHLQPGTGRWMLLSPACGPAPVTSVPVTSTAASTAPLRKVNPRSAFGTTQPRHTAIGFADLDVEQDGQPHHRHRGQQVDGDRPPQQPGEHGDSADHRLHHRRGRHQPRVHQHLAPTPGPGDGQDRRDRREHHGEGDHPVAELDGLVDAAAPRRCGDGDETAREALRPGGAAQAGCGHPDDRAGHRDTALGQDDQCGDQPLCAQAGLGEQVNEPHETRPKRRGHKTTARSRGVAP